MECLSQDVTITYVDTALSEKLHNHPNVEPP